MVLLEVPIRRGAKKGKEAPGTVHTLCPPLTAPERVKSREREGTERARERGRFIENVFLLVSGAPKQCNERIPPIIFDYPQ